MCTRLITAIFCITMITACGSKSGSADTEAAPTVGGGSPQQPAIVTPVVGGGTDPVLVVYTASVVRNVTTGGQTYHVTLTGSCTVYAGQTYCWDDGWHRPTAAMGFDYWGFIVQGGTILQGQEGIADAVDPFESTPMLITANVVNQLPGNVIEQDGSLSTMVTRLLASGTQSQVSCTDDGAGTLTCPAFTLVVQ